MDLLSPHKRLKRSKRYIRQVSIGRLCKYTSIEWIFCITYIASARTRMGIHRKAGPEAHGGPAAIPTTRQVAGTARTPVAEQMGKRPTSARQAPGSS